MGWVGRLLRRESPGGSRHSINTVDQYAQVLGGFGFAGIGYPTGLGPAPGLQTTMGQERAEPIPADFTGFVRSAYRTNGVIFACMLARQLAFSTVRFTYQRINTGKPSELFGETSLALLEEPWAGGTTQDLLTRTIQDADLAGNAYWTVSGGELVRLRPDWVQIICVPRLVPGLSRDDAGRQVPAVLGWKRLGYVYTDGGSSSGEEPVLLPVEDVAHFAPIPDPEASFRGMSWLTPVVRELQADSLMTRHRIKLFEHGATPNMIVKHPLGATPEKVRTFADMLAQEHGGVDNAYRTMHLYPGADATLVGRDLQQLEFKSVQGHGETRIAAAARVPPVIVGLSEGLDAATYSNYGQARRAFADGTCHPLWANLAGSFAPLLRRDLTRLTGRAPGAVRLWYDARDVPLLREDAKEAAEIAEIQARTIRTYVDGGYTPDSARRAVLSGDLGLLVHTGYYSVQLRPAGEMGIPANGGTAPSA